jgi:hypothetical protein
MEGYLDGGVFGWMEDDRGNYGFMGGVEGESRPKNNGLL